ncbi:ZinT/AdcA family metal-binding protein [Oceanobacillus locisalsi]|uniref:ZinT/AdcA family metal-binding protein n=1 Tax=Oceanobacillus locisalsi TaxID=546107 RepID=A0ABW3NIN6_9BACI
MSKKLLRIAMMAFLALILAACQDTADEDADSDEETAEDTEATEEEEHDHDHESEENAEAGVAELEGFIDHYHTGDTVELTAIANEDDSDGHWHWYIRGGDEGEWEEADGGDGETFAGEATELDQQQLKATFYDDNHEVISETDPVTVVIDDHDSDVYEGYFDDEDVEDRDISDWAGEWKSVYPYFEEGALDEVYEHRAEEDGEMTFEEYKEYYEAGYETSVDNIEITEGGEFTFHDGDETYSGTYVNDGYEILEYEAGNRGVRFMFELEEGDEEAPQNIQFSDHNIAPHNSSHFHIYWGDDKEELLEEVDHWPTYYPVEWSEEQIVDDLYMH